MGYFPNNTVGELYEAEYCRNCIHYKDNDIECCPVLFIHLVYNYDQFNDMNLKVILESFIPRKGIENEQCTMFVNREAT